MAQQHDDGFHPARGDYIQIGVILAVLTAIEVSLYFLNVQEVIATPALLVLTAMKFVLVAFWFMHLRFDSPTFRRLFAMGLVLAVLIFGIVAATFYFGPI